jgi:hypothetical protein
MKCKCRFFRLKKMYWCKAVSPFHFFLGWTEKSIHINVPLLFCSLIVSISKP